VVAGELLCAIHQPNFFPRLSTLAKLFTADVWVVLDDVQFARRDYQHRCRLAAPGDNDAHQWLTVPVHLPGGRGTLIGDVRIDDPSRARRKVALLLQQYYRRSPHWADFIDPLQEVLDAFGITDRLAEISQTSTTTLLSMLGWTGVIWRSSDLPTSTGRSERLADLTSAAGATTYLCGTGGARYLNDVPFTIRGLSTQMFSTPEHRDPRIWMAARHASTISPLMAVGPAALAKELGAHRAAVRELRRPCGFRADFREQIQQDPMTCPRPARR
jgi:hypothetical protein